MTPILQVFGPLAIFAGLFWIGVIYYVRWLDNRAARRGFVLDFVPFVSQINDAELDLPEMRDEWRTVA